MAGEFLKQFLVIEDNPELLNYRFRFENFMMWPLVRHFVVSKLVTRTNNSPSLPLPNKKRALTTSYLRNILFNSPFRRSGQQDYLYFNSGITNIKKHDVYFNRVTDLFAGTFLDSSILIEDSANYEFKQPRAYPKVRAHDSLLITPWLMSKLGRLVKVDSERIQEFIDFISRIYPALSQEDLTSIANLLKNHSKRLPLLRSAYDRLFDINQPKLIFLEDGSYGYRSFILKWAKERGIKTGELQHGLVTPNHIAYNYGDGILRSDEYKTYLPEHFLSYGQHWINQINLPVKKWVIGNPHFTETLKIHAGIFKPSKEILILTAGLSPAKMQEITTRLVTSDSLRDYHFVFRPHPQEKSSTDKIYPEILKNRNIKIDCNDDLYASFCSASIIVSEFSTVIYEAQAFCPNIYLLRDASAEANYSGNFATLISNAADIINHIETSIPSRATLNDSDDLWARDWQANFKRFIETIVPDR